MNRTLLIVGIVGAVGCSGSDRRVSEPIQTEPEVDAAPSEPPPTGPRVIELPGTYGGLMSAASVLEDRGEGASPQECMLRSPEHRGWPWILEAEISASVRPVPPPPGDLDARLVDSAQPVLVITRWGQIGSRSFDVALAAITSAAPLPDQGSAVLLLTDRGVYLRRTDQRVSMGRTAPRPLPERGASIEGLEEGTMIYVTAEADVPLTQLRRLLAALPEGASVVFAVALGQEIRVPDPPPLPEDRETGLCPEGLPDPSEGTVRGELEAPLVIGALGPLRTRARECLETAVATRSPGGRVELMIRIAPDGQVSDACLGSDELGGTELRNCLIEAALATRFPVPRPQGFVDVQLPLRLQPSSQRPLCP
jgi:hypothetical protein